MQCANLRSVIEDLDLRVLYPYLLIAFSRIQQIRVFSASQKFQQIAISMC